MNSWETIRPSFLYLLNERIKEPIAVEVGVERGRNALQMLKNHKGLKLYLIDPYVGKDVGTEEHMKEMLESIEPFKERAFFHRLSSVNGVGMFFDGLLDYVYIDGAHDYKSVTNDLNAWAPKVKKGGILSGHDWGEMQVREAVTDFFKKSDYKVLLTMCPFSRELLLNKESRAPFEIPNKFAEMMDWWIPNELER